ncbi:MAG TPA: TerC/Alx family metal homeostasis membrane protein [Phycisphaerae bacterium]|nr:TerC/Alx family metal homeostasis membrane protein [Phycisphaerae bacterium]
MTLLLIGFIIFVLLMLALDLGVFNKKAHVITASEATVWTCLIVILALIFNVLVYWIYSTNFNEILGPGEIGTPEKGWQAAGAFLTGYIIEQSLSLDNVFVIALIFAYFGVPAKYQHRVLFWGILGALVMRGVMIGVGAALIERFTWITYVFGAILILTAVKMLMAGEEKVDPEKNWLVRIARRIYPVTPHYEGEHFFTQLNGRRAITPLFLVLLVVESTDLLFAVDSIPAIFAITQDPFIVFTSNVFAILGLRSLYFVLAAVVDMFRYLKMSLVFVLAFVGVKMLIHHYFEISTPVSLAVVIGTLLVGVLASILSKKPTRATPVEAAGGDVAGVAELAFRQIKRGMIFLMGATVILIGIVMLVLPGPALLVIPAGFAILATEFVWAKKLLNRLKRKAMSVAKSVGIPMQEVEELPVTTDRDSEVGRDLTEAKKEDKD